MLALVYVVELWRQQAASVRLLLWLDAEYIVECRVYGRTIKIACGSVVGHTIDDQCKCLVPSCHLY